MFKKTFFNLSKKIYFTPALFSIIALGTFFSILYLDLNVIPQYQDALPRILITDIELGKTIFATLIGAILTMLTITFTTMLVVLTLYGAQLSPRAMQDFLEKKTTLRTLGYFSGVFIFCLVALFFMKPSTAETLVLAPLSGIVVTVFCIFVFIYFVFDVSKSIQVNLYIQTLVDENQEAIERTFAIDEMDNGITSKMPEGFEESIQSEGIAIESKTVGFIQLYKVNRLWEFAKKNSIIIYCDTKVGEHVLEDTVLMHVYNANEEFKENLWDNREYLMKSLLIGDETNKHDDVELGLRKLVEIAVRALSPGINDPNTAIYCIRNLGFLLGKIGERFDRMYYLDEDNEAVLVVQNTPFVKLLYQSFYQIALHGSNDLFVMSSLFEALTIIARGDNKEVNHEVWEFGKYLTESLKDLKLRELDRIHINSKIYQLAVETKQNPMSILLGSKGEQKIILNK